MSYEEFKNAICLALNALVYEILMKAMTQNVNMRVLLHKKEYLRIKICLHLVLVLHLFL